MAPPFHAMNLATSMAAKGRRPSATKTTHTAVPQVDDEVAKIEDFPPPPWRSVLNNRADLGYPDFYPSRPGFNQTEDVLTEDNVKNGFSAKTFVAIGAESFSMHGPIYGHLMNGCLGMLNRLGQEIAEKRDEAMPQIGERGFRIPVRVTYNDVKRLQFLADLANPSVPLSRLMRNPVPHGFKGVELFDSMFAPQLTPANNRSASGPGPSSPPSPIPIDRAIWFIRVLGANEISAHRGRAQPAAPPVAAPSPLPATPSSTNTAPQTTAMTLSSSDWYSQEFTNMFTSWLRIQLGQLVLPVKTAPKTGVPPPKGPAGVLGDEKARSRWSAKWNYSGKLLQEMRSKRLISTRILVSWMVETLSASNLAQIGFVLQMIGQHLPDVSKHAPLARACLRVACAKSEEIHSSPAASSLGKIVEMLQSLIRSLFDANSRVLLAPATWRDHAATLEATLVPPTDNLEIANQPDSHDGTLRTRPDRRRQLAMAKARSDALQFRPAAAESTSSPRRQQMEDLRKLDAMDADTNMTALCKSYFDGSASPTSPNIDMARLEEKTFVLLNWAMGLFQLGVHRAYAVDTLLTIWSNLHSKAQAKASKPVTIDFFWILYKWLDTCEAPRNKENAFAIGITFGDLTRQGLFSYRRYLQVLIARGHSARSRLPGLEPSHHLPLLEAMPIFVQAKELIEQRKLALCGDDPEACRALEEDDERMMDEFKQEVKEYVPELFGLEHFGRSRQLRDVVYHEMPSAPAMNRYLFLQARFWLARAAADSLKQRDSAPPIDASAFVRVLHVFELCNGFSTRADFLITALTSNEDEEILDAVIDSIRRDADVWTANDKWPLLTNALLDRNQSQDARGRHHPALASLLLELARRGRISDDDEYEVKVSIEKHPKPVPTSVKGWVDIKESTGTLARAITSGDISTSMDLAGKLHTRHGAFSSWAASWWSTIIQAIQAAEGRRSTAVTNAALGHIEAVDDHTSDGLDAVLSSWLDNLGVPDAVDLLAGKSARIVVDIILNLVAHRRLHIVPKILDKLAYAVWKHAGSSAVAAKGTATVKGSRGVEASMILAQHLLLTVPPDSDLPPINLQQSLILQTQRGIALNSVNVPLLIRHLPFLVVLDAARGTSDRIRAQISTLLKGLASTPQFKAAAFRHLHVLKDAFLSNEWSKPTLSGSIETAMVDALKLIMSQDSSSTTNKLDTIASLDSRSKFSAWRWTSIVLGMRVEFKRLAMRIENGENATEARQTLNRLVHDTLDRDATADDTDLLCETFRGIEHVAAQEIIAVGLERLTSLLSQIISAETSDALTTLVQSVDQMLRVLDNASNASTSVTPTEHSVLAARHGLLDLIAVALQSIERQLSDEDSALPDGVAAPKPGDICAAVVTLLKFTLGLPVVDNLSPAAPRPDFGRLAGSFLRVLVAISPNASPKTMESLIDLLTHIVDSAPAVSRNAVHTSLMGEMGSSSIITAIQKDPEFKFALPWTSPPRRPMALTNATMLGEGVDAHFSLDDRPWEMVEHLDPPVRQLAYGERFLASKPLKDVASIPMALFRPRIKRDAVPGAHEGVSQSDNGETEDVAEVEESHRPWEAYASERNLGTGEAGEPIAVRRLATSLYTAAEEVHVEDDAATVHSVISPASTIVALPPASPAIPTSAAQPRRASARNAATALGSNKNPITLDDDPSDEDSDDDDDEEDSDDSPEAIKPPAGKRPRTGGKTVAGKTTRKTTGGKTVSRKGVSGKGMRGGKAPAKSRKRD